MLRTRLLRGKGTAALRIACALGLGVMAMAQAEGATRLEDFLRRPAYSSVTISPDGKYLAANAPLDDRTALAVIRVSDLQVNKLIDPGKDAHVDFTVWKGDEQLLSTVSLRIGRRAQPYPLGSLLSVNVNGGDRRFFGGNILDPLIDDPEHVLIQRCRKPLMRGCLTEVVRQRIDGMGHKDVIVAPVPDAEFFVDHRHNVRFSWTSDDEDIQKLFLFTEGKWISINDEASSGVEVYPVAVSADDRYAFLISERLEGPDVVERMDLATAKRDIVAEDGALDPGGLVWSFDRREPIGVRFGHGLPRIHFFDPSHPHVALMKELERSFEGEVVSVVSSTRKGEKSVLWVGSDRDSGRFYLMDTASGELSLLARETPWLDASRQSPVREISFKARDGVRIGGYLTRPEGVANPPLVVMPHGGPFGARDAWLFDTETQLLASMGYATLRVNFRGSSGHGRSFIESGYRQWGLAMQDDVTDATRWAVSEIAADAKKICIWGSSYGGYAAVMATIREPDLYRCAIGVSAPYDLPTIYKWGDVQRSRWGRARLAVTLGEDEDTLAMNSSTQHADKIKAAILLVQGGRDPRVSPEHVKLMQRALDRAGKSYEAYRPLQETHGFYGAETRLEYYRRVLGFLDANLKQ